MTEQARKLLSEQPELIREIVEASETHKADTYKSMECGKIYFVDHDKNWTDFVQSNTAQKDYEILSFMFAESEEWTMQQNGLYKTFGVEHTLEYLLSNKHYKIHSVKRLSDSAVFTVGETITDGVNETEIISIKPNGLLVGYKGSLMIGDAKKLKKALFTTEDGKQVFEGDSMYLLGITNWIIKEVSACKNPFDGDGKFKYFSTEQAALEYVLINKPCLSVADLTDIYDFGITKEYYLNKIIGIVKTKLP